ncbi:hypothetical protein [Demequina aurantiaca]|uniref:hypothetical protein n=1 Tax=Demequina aurantiaca TaxID=676200 RepID=UPI003D3370CC
MTPQTAPAIEQVRVPSHAGWQGQQGSTTGLIAVSAVLMLAVVAYGVVMMSDPASAMKVLGAGVILTVGLTGWMLAAHLRVSRVRVVRVKVSDDTVVFKGAQEVVLPLRAFAGGGAMILAGWVWAVATVPSGRLTLLTLLVVPVLGLTITVVGVRAWFRGAQGHQLTLSRSGLVLRIPRNQLRATWDEVREAGLRGNRIEVGTTSGIRASWAAMDLASDPVIVAELVNFYVRRQDARAEIGQGTLARLRSGEF